MLGWITDYVTDSPVTYAVITAATLIDADLPLIPAEGVVVLSAVLASQDELIVWFVLVAAMAGSFTGDNISYLLGNKLGPVAQPHLFRSERAQRRLRWAAGMLDERGGTIILVARFIPGGRTATTFACGMLEFPWRRFVAIDALAITVWAGYATALGYFGGEAFAENFWLSAGVTLGIAVLVTAGAEAFRRLRMRGAEAS